MARLDGKVVLISGGARGMGAAHAKLMIAEGAEVVIGDLQDKDGEALAKELGPSVTYVHLDVSKPADWDAFRAAYAGELESDTAEDSVRELRGHVRKGSVTLLYAARDEEHNNAVALKEWLEKRKRS